MDEERIRRLREDPDFKSLVQALEAQAKDRVDQFFDDCVEDEPIEGTTDEQAPDKISD